MQPAVDIADLKHPILENTGSVELLCALIEFLPSVSNSGTRTIARAMASMTWPKRTRGCVFRRARALADAADTRSRCARYPRTGLVGALLTLVGGHSCVS